MHMVHSLDDKFKSLTTYEKLVIGVFFTNEDAGDIENPLLDAFNLDTLKNIGKMRPSLAKYMRSQPQSFYHYYGSLTTPPCTEFVTWMVMKEPQLCSDSQLATIKRYLKHNYRHVNPVNGRKIYTAMPIE
eukprot:TRINITY_DN7238_c0_g1_i20.p1 TRINITY_DN7238_c0_g1~~TRINITY_DN7238_c0_g1_i20.p1  ORF type:complete len:130 (+),score=15.70 TRINITY_DN7238_c0_g1_i20:673-1062(+)